MGFLNWVRGVDDRLEPEQTTQDSHTVPTREAILEALDKTLAMALEAQLSPVIIARVDRVTRAVRAAIPLTEREGMGSQDVYAIMATATDYLPEALSAYIRLPRDWADRRPVDRGRTALMLLIDQLDLLAATMDKILDAVASADATALVAHGRFLTERFGGQADGGDLALGDDAPVPKMPPTPEASAEPDVASAATSPAQSPEAEQEAEPQTPSAPPVHKDQPTPRPAPSNPLDLD